MRVRPAWGYSSSSGSAEFMLLRPLRKKGACIIQTVLRQIVEETAADPEV